MAAVRAAPVVTRGGQSIGHGGQLRSQGGLGQKMNQGRGLRQAGGPGGEKGFIVLHEGRKGFGGQHLIRRGFPAQGLHGLGRAAPERGQEGAEFVPERTGRSRVIGKVCGGQPGRALGPGLGSGYSKARRIRRVQAAASRPLQTQRAAHNFQQGSGQPGQGSKTLQAAAQGGVIKRKESDHIFLP